MKGRNFKTKLACLLCCLIMTGASVYGMLSGIKVQGAPGDVDDSTLRFVQMDSGVEHTVAITADGDVYGWGSNSFNQLGLVDTTIVVPQETPRLLLARNEIHIDTDYNYGTSAGDRVIKVACAEYATALLTYNGEAFLAGDNYFSQLGAITPKTDTSSSIRNASENVRWYRYNKGILQANNSRYVFDDVYAGSVNFIFKLRDTACTYNGKQINAYNVYAATGPATFMLGSETYAGGGLNFLGNPVIDTGLYFYNATTSRHLTSTDIQTADITGTRGNITDMGIRDVLYTPDHLFNISGDRSGHTSGRVVTDIAMGSTAMYFVDNSSLDIQVKGKLSHSLSVGTSISDNVVVATASNVYTAHGDTTLTNIPTLDAQLQYAITISNSSANSPGFTAPKLNNAQITSTATQYYQPQIKNSRNTIVYPAVGATNNQPKLFAAENYGYALHGAKTYIAWGNNTTGQLTPDPNLITLNNQIKPTIINLDSVITGAGAQIMSMAAGKVKHVNYAQRENTTDTEFNKRVVYRPMTEIIADEESAEYVSALLVDNINYNDVYVWGNVTGGIQPDGYHKLEIEGNAKIVMLYASYKELYMISEHGKLYVYDGTIQNGRYIARVINNFLEYNGTPKTNVTITENSSEKRSISFDGAGATGTVNLLEGISNLSGMSTTTKPTGSGDAFLQSAYGDAFRFLIPQAETGTQNGGILPVNNFIPNEYIRDSYGSWLNSSLLADSSYALENAHNGYSDSQFVIRFEMLNKDTNAIDTTYGNNGDITQIISNYISYNFTHKNTILSGNQSGMDVNMNIKALMRTPEGRKIRATLMVGIYDAYTREDVENFILYDTHEISFDITIANTRATQRAIDDINITASGSYVPAVVDVNNPAFNTYSYTLMDSNTGFNAIASYFGLTDVNTILSEVIAQDSGYRGSYNWLFSDVDGDRLMADTGFFDQNKLTSNNFGPNGIYASNFDVYRKIITISVQLDAPTAKDVRLFRNFYGFYGVSVDAQNMLTFNYEILQVVAKLSTMEGITNAYRPFSTNYVELRDREYPSITNNSLGVYPLSGDTNSIKVKVDSTIYFKESTLNVPEPHYTAAAQLAYMSSVTIPITQFFADDSLLGFYPDLDFAENDLGMSIFLNTFDRDQVRVEVSSDWKSITLTALSSIGKIEFLINIRRGGFNAELTSFQDIEQSRLFRITVVMREATIDNRFDRIPSAEINASEYLTVRVAREIEITRYFRGLGDGSHISVLSVSSSNRDVLTTEVINSDTQVDRILFKPLGAGRVSVVITAQEFNVTKTEKFDFVVLGTANYSSETYKVNGRLYDALDNFRQAIISINGLGGVDSSSSQNVRLEFVEVLFFKIENGVEVQIPNEEASDYLIVAVEGDIVYYDTGIHASSLASNRLNVIFVFNDVSNGNQYSIRQMIEITQFTIEPNVEAKPGHSVFFFDVRESQGLEFTISASDLARYGLPASEFKEITASLYTIQTVYAPRTNDLDAKANIATWTSSRSNIVFTPLESGEQTMGALISYTSGSGNVTYYTIFFKISVSGIIATLSSNQYMKNFIIAAVISIVIILVVFFYKMSVYWKKYAEQQKIVKKNKELIKARENLHGRGTAMTRREMVKTKLKLDDPKYARMMHDVKMEKQVEATGVVDKKDKKKRQKKSIEDLKAELAAKKAKYAEMQSGGGEGQVFEEGQPIDGSGYIQFDTDKMDDIPQFNFDESDNNI